MSGLIRSVAGDGTDQADELEREAKDLILRATEKLREASVIRAMQLVAATWTPRTMNGTNGAPASSGSAGG